MNRASPLIILFILIPSLPFGATAQSSPQQSQQPPSTRPADERLAFMLRSLSPYLIEWLIDTNEELDLGHIFRLLKIDVENSGPGKCNSDCSAETFDLHIPGEHSTRTIALRVSFEDGKYFQYLIFKSPASPESTGWNFIGSLYTNRQQDGPPRHRVESGNDRSWLVIREALARAPSAKAFVESWHEIKENRLSRVLSFPVEGRIESCPNRTGRSFKTLLLRHELENGVYTIPVQFFVSYDIHDCARAGHEVILFAKSKRVYFVWDGVREQFRFDASRSDLKEAEMSAVYSLADLSSKEVADYNFDEVSAIAKGKNQEAKNWLRQFLATLEDGTRKTALLKMLRD